MLIGVCPKIVPLIPDFLNQRNSFLFSTKFSGEKKGSLDTIILQGLQYKFATFCIFMSRKYQGNPRMSLVSPDNSSMGIGEVSNLSPNVKGQGKKTYECKE